MALSVNCALGPFPILKETKEFETWLNDAFSPKGQAEDKGRVVGARERAREEEAKKEFEEEAYEDRNYNEDRT